MRPDKSLRDRLDDLERLVSLRRPNHVELPAEIAERILKLLVLHEGEPGWDRRCGPQVHAEQALAEALAGEESS